MDECDLSGVCEVCKEKCIAENSKLEAQLLNVKEGLRRIDMFLQENMSGAPRRGVIDGWFGGVNIVDINGDIVHTAESMADLVDCMMVEEE